MKRWAVLHIALCVLLMAAACVLVIVGCQSGDDSIGGPGGQDIPQDFVYAGNRYIFTGVEVAHEHLGANTPSNVIYIGSTFQFGEYDVYLIEGIDEDEAIALKICPGGGYLYYKYEKVYGQEEPADFAYQGRDYRVTGEIIAIQRATEFDALGEPESVRYLGSVIYQGTTYHVYSIQIQGSDYSESIALRIAKAGKTVGFYYYYFKYDTQ